MTDKQTFIFRDITDKSSYRAHQRMKGNVVVRFLSVAISLSLFRVSAANPTLVIPTRPSGDNQVSIVDATLSEKSDLYIATCEAGHEGDPLMAIKGALWAFRHGDLTPCENKIILGAPMGFVKEWHGNKGLWLVSATTTALWFQEANNFAHNAEGVFTRKPPLAVSFDGIWHIEQSADNQDYELVEEKGKSRLKLGIKTQGEKFFFHKDKPIFAAIDTYGGQISCFKIAEAGQLVPLESIPESATPQFVTGACFSEDAHILAVGSGNSGIYLYDLGEKLMLTTNLTTPSRVAAMRFDEAGNLVVVDSAGSLISINLASMKSDPPRHVASQGVSCVIPQPMTSRILAFDHSGDCSIYNTDSNAIEAQISLLSHDGTWIASVPDGRFDGSEDGWKDALWRFDTQPPEEQPIESFFNEFFHPGLVADILSENLNVPTQQISNLRRTGPTIRVSCEGLSSQDSRFALITLKNEGTDAARDVRVFRNGTLVDTLTNLPAGQSKESKIKIRAGTNQISAYAFNRDDVRGKTANSEIIGPETLRRSGDLYVLAIGINGYSDLPQLTNAVREARLVSSILNGGREQIRKFAVDLKDSLESLKKAGMVVESSQLARLDRLKANSGEAHIITLLNEKASRTQILAELARISSAAEPEDSVIFFFAGHGGAEGDNYVLCPSDFVRSTNRKSDGKGVGISMADLENEFRPLEAEVSAVILTSCQSGQMLDDGSDKRHGPINARGFSQLAYEKGMYLFAAVKPNEGVQENLGTSLAAHALAEEALGEAAAGAGNSAPTDGIELRDVLEYAVRRTPELDENGDSQAIGGLRMTGSGSPGKQPVLLRRKSQELTPLLLSLTPVRLDPLGLEAPSAEKLETNVSATMSPVGEFAIVPPVNRAGSIKAMVIIPGSRLVTADEKGKLDLWSLPALGHLHSLPVQGPVALAIDSTGERLACLTLQSDLLIINATNFNVVSEFKGVLPSA